MRTGHHAWRARNQIVAGLNSYGNRGLAGQIGVNFNLRNSLPIDKCDTMGDTCVPGSTTCSAQCVGRASHPEWRAHFGNGTAATWRQDGVYAWQIAGNNAFQDFFATDRVQELTLAHQADPYSPQATAISIEGAEGASPPEDQHPRAVALGNAADSRLTLANTVARRLQSTFPGWSSPSRT